jgi:thiol-disulfide isomerase/thioredoxin
VLDSTGTPAANVHVVAGEVGHASVFYTTPQEMMVATPGIAAPESARWAFDVRTDAEGRFEVSGLAAGEFGIIAATESEIVVARALVADDATPLELRLERGARVRFAVSALAFDPTKHLVELRSARTFENVQLLPKLAPFAAGELERLQLATAERGWSFESFPLPRGTDWRASGSELVVAQDYRAILFDLPAAMDALTVFDRQAQTGPGVFGSVLGPDGAPLANVSVVARSRTTPAEEIGDVSDARGRYGLAGLRPGTWDVVARRWVLRELAGCGNGRMDLETRAEVVVSGEPWLRRSAPPSFDLRVATFAGAPKVGDTATDFRVQSLAGTELTLASLRGKVVLLDFWATWCGICRMEFPRLTQTYTELASGGKFEIVGVSVDTDPELVRRFVASRDIRWPQTALGVAAANPIARLYNVNSTPATVLIDKEGKIAALDLTGKELRAKIDELLAAPAK